MTSRVASGPSSTAIDDLQRALDRLAAHAAAPPAPDRLTAPDPLTGERWDTGQVWAHLAEFGGYWLGELRTILAPGRTASDHEPTPFGRTKADPHRIAMIEAGRHVDIARHLDAVRRDVAAWQQELAQLTPAEWQRRGVHPTLGEMTIPQFLDEFVVGHYHEHADQLDQLHTAGGS